jgi:hypothetical protein
VKKLPLLKDACFVLSAYFKLLRSEMRFYQLKWDINLTHLRGIVDKPSFADGGHFQPPRPTLKVVRHPEHPPENILLRSPSYGMKVT